MILYATPTPSVTATATAQMFLCMSSQQRNQQYADNWLNSQVEYAECVQDGALSMWTSQGMLSHQLESPPAVPPTSYTLAVAPNGMWLAAAPRTPLLLLYDLQQPRLITAMHPKNQNPILQLAFLADSRTLAALTSDSKLTFTDVENARHLYTVQLPSPSTAVCVERRGNYAAAVTTGGTASLHDLSVVREAAALVPPPPGTLSAATTLKRTAPRELADLDLRPLPPQRSAAAVPQRSAAAVPASAAPPRGRSTARPHTRARAANSASRSASWGRGLPPLSVPRARALSNESPRGRGGSSGRRQSSGGIVRVRRCNNCSSYTVYGPTCSDRRLQRV